MAHSDRYTQGWEKLKEIDGEAGEKVIHGLKDIAPDLGRFVIEYAFGDIYTRVGLDLKAKEIAVVAALTAMGTAQPQLKVHLNGALNTGSTISEIKEVILQMSVYAGFPSCINGMVAFKEVLHERKAQGFSDPEGKAPSATNPSDRQRVGELALSELDGWQVGRLEAAFGEFAPEIVKFTLEYGYADIFSRDNLDKQHRQIATIAALTAMGNARPQLKFHVNAGLNIGLTVENIREIMLLMSVYAGFPHAINGTMVLKEVVDERAEERKR